MRRTLVPAALALGLLATWLGCGRTTLDVPCVRLDDGVPTVYASPWGLDFDPGTEESPTSLSRAIALARAHLPGPMRIALRGGSYQLANPLAFTASDSGLALVACAGETPVLSGGTVVTGWSDDGTGRGVYQAALSTSTRDVWVQGTRAVRARSDQIDTASWSAADHGFTAPDATIAHYARPRDVELVGRNTWKLFRCGLSDVSGTSLVVRDPDWSNSQSQPGFLFGATELLWYENADELLTTPGYWYWNASTSKLGYVPRDGEDMSSAVAVAGTLESLVTITGTRGSPAAIGFHGISFAETTWREPTLSGYAAVQDGVHGTTGATPSEIDGRLMPAAVTLTYASGSTFSGCTFSRMGAAALAIRTGSQSVQVEGCTFDDIGGSAITLGDVQPADRQPADPLDRVRYNAVRDCSFSHTGAQYPDCTSIFGGFISDSVFDHNELGETPIGHIAIGWGWNQLPVSPPDVAGNNVISNNRAHDDKQAVIGETRMQDMGSIYILEPSPGTVVTGNWVTASVWDYGAFYVDAGSPADFSSPGPTITGNVSDQAGGSVMLMLSMWASHATCTGNFWVGGESSWVNPSCTVSGNINSVSTAEAMAIEAAAGPRR